MAQKVVLKCFHISDFFSRKKSSRRILPQAILFDYLLWLLEGSYLFQI